MLNPPEQSSGTGSVVLLRKDGKPLHPVHVHALFGYSALTLLDPIYPQGGCISHDMLLASRIDQVSQEGFQAWYSTMWQKCSIQRSFVPSPFDIQDDFEDEDPNFNLRHI